MKLKVKPEGREGIYIPQSTENLKRFVKSRGLETIHNFIPSGAMMLGADHSVDSVMKDIDKAARMAVFTDETTNMEHSLALIFGNADNGDIEKLECYDIGAVKEEELELLE